MEKIIELRARSVDVTKHDYYNLLYCFHVCRSNYRKGMYKKYGCMCGYYQYTVISITIFLLKVWRDNNDIALASLNF